MRVRMKVVQEQQPWMIPLECKLECEIPTMSACAVGCLMHVIVCVRPNFAQRIRRVTKYISIRGTFEGC